MLPYALVKETNEKELVVNYKRTVFYEIVGDSLTNLVTDKFTIWQRYMYVSHKVLGGQYMTS